MNRSVLIGCLLVLILVSSAGLTAVGPLSAASASDGTTMSANEPADTVRTVETTNQAMTSDRDFDRTTFVITVHDNGSATWTFEYERTLEDQDDVDAFSEFADEFESSETQLYQDFVLQAERLADSGSDTTDREMEARDFNRSTSIEQGISPTGSETGVVEMSFVWDGFATVDEDGTVTAGDVFNGLVLEDDQRLIVEPDDGLEFRSVQSDGEYATESVEDASSVTWRGEIEFIPGEPRMTLAPVEETNPSPVAGTVDSFFSDLTHPLVVVGLVIATLIGVGAIVRYRSRDSDPPTVDSAHTSDETTEPPTAEAEPEPPISGGELLTDEDRVVSLLENNGGRMKQVDIVEETGWSKSKVSMLLSEMESDDTISKLRVGRENIISLEGHEPEATKSPFDE